MTAQFQPGDLLSFSEEMRVYKFYDAHFLVIAIGTIVDAPSYQVINLRRKEVEIYFQHAVERDCVLCQRVVG